MTPCSHTHDVKRVLARLPAYARLAWALWRDGRLGRSQKALLALAVGYSVSPVDLIPGFIPVVGQMDDLLVLLAAIRRSLRRLPSQERERLLAAAGITSEDVDADYLLVRAAVHSLIRRAVRLGGWTAGTALRACVRTGYRGLSALMDRFTSHGGTVRSRGRRG
ncbi:MAG: YkvA family protein [Bacillota bacterium]